MSKVNSEDPSFPVMHANGTFTGLTKREYFAAMAMQAILSRENIVYSDFNFITNLAITHADTIIKELSK